MYLVWGSSALSQCPMSVGDTRTMKDLDWVFVCPCVLPFYSQLRLESVLSDLVDTGSFQKRRFLGAYPE